MTPQHQLPALFRGSFGWTKVTASLLQRAQLTGCSRRPAGSTGQSWRCPPAPAWWGCTDRSQPALRRLSWAACAARGSAPPFWTPDASSESSSPFLHICKPSSALPAAVHQHDETLPYRSVPHCELNLSQRHPSPAARQLHSQGF